MLQYSPSRQVYHGLARHRENQWPTEGRVWSGRLRPRVGRGATVAWSGGAGPALRFGTRALPPRPAPRRAGLSDSEL